MKKLLLIALLGVFAAQNIFSQCGTTVSGILTTCASSCDGMVYFTPTSGTPPYDIIITGGPSVQFSGIYTWNNVCPGSYHYDITDAALSCHDTGTVTITALPLPVMNLPGMTAICQGGNIQLAASGAATYAWSPGNNLSSTSTAMVVASPTVTTVYTVVGTSVDGCTSSSSVTVVVNPLPAVLMNVTNASCYVCCDGILAPQVISGTPPFSFLWSNGGTTAIQNNLCVGTYTITVADMNGCMGSGSAAVDTGYSVTISYANVTASSTFCYAPFNTTFSFYGSSVGYPSTDSLALYVNFGDGNDTLFYHHLSVNPFFNVALQHTYQFPGTYSTQFIATGPDGNADTVTNINNVIGYTSCGNIDGRVYLDANSNCTYDNGEPVLAGIPVQLFSGPNLIATALTGTSGYYYYFMPNSNYTIQVAPQITNYGYTVTCPASGQINISGVPSYGNDIGVTCSPSYDLAANLACPIYRPGFVRHIYPSIQNFSCQPVSGQAKLIISNPNLTFQSAYVPPSFVSGDTLIWNFSNLTNTSNFYIGNVDVLTSPSAQLGDTICVTFMVEPSSGDVNPANNTITGCRPVSNSYDPNDKSVSPEGFIAAGSWLTYTIRFQNTGNDTAYNVFILDTMDANMDMNTFQAIGSSHTYSTYILDGNVVKFDFSNIMLPDSNVNEPLSNGWISYRIKSQTGLMNGTILNNTANIYFDFNPAVVTNTTSTLIDNTVGVEQINSEALELIISPNPAVNECTIYGLRFTIEKVEIFNMLGEKVLEEHRTSVLGHRTISVADLPSGIYFVKVKGESQERMGKFVKE